MNNENKMVFEKWWKKPRKKKRYFKWCDKLEMKIKYKVSRIINTVF